jgi:hypothetical protein
MCVQAFEAARPPGSADPARQLRTELALIAVCTRKTRAEIRVRRGSGRPALDASRGFKSRKLRREV